MFDVSVYADRRAGKSISSYIRRRNDGTVPFSALWAFTNSLRRYTGDENDRDHNYGAWGFEGAPPYLLEISIENDTLTGNPLPVGFTNNLAQHPEERVNDNNFNAGDMPMSHANLLNEICALVNDKLQVVLTGAPGTGKTYLAQEVAARIILGNDIPNAEEIEDRLKENNMLSQYQFVQFHPGYDYSDFVEGIKPNITNGAADFSLEDGIFKKFCLKAAEAFNNAADKATAPKYVMIIDEINRADLSRVFGELFFGLEKDYRGKEIRTQYDYLKRENGSDNFKDGYSAFVIPRNLYIIGTMNDIDRSVESFDFALRRRFGWREVSWRDSLSIIDRHIPGDIQQNQQKLDEIRTIMTRVNEEIIKRDLGLEDAFALGGAYFKDAAEKSWDELWRNSIKIILNEYLRGNRCDKKIEEIERSWVEIVNEEAPGIYPIPEVAPEAAPEA